MSAVAEKKSRKSLERFNEELHAQHLEGQWEFDDLLEASIGGPPKPNGIPFIWKYKTIREKLMETIDIIDDPKTTRRAFALSLPSGRFCFAPGVQLYQPGEIAYAHRHMPNAIRFVIEGDKDVYTVVDGEKCIMETNNLILTPSWTWHDHHNESKDKYVITFDVVDVATPAAFNCMFYEKYGEKAQKLKSSKSDYIQERVSFVRPTWEKPKKNGLPLVYEWKEVEKKLNALRDSIGNPYDGISLEYINPITGGHALSTLGLWAQLFRPGEETKSHRHTYSHFYYVIKGSGTTKVGDTELNWEEKDMFFIPNWSWHNHKNNSMSEDAVLFGTNNLPALEPLGFYREEPEESLYYQSAPDVPKR